MMIVEMEDEYAENHQEALRKIYSQALRTQLITWQAIHHLQDELEHSEEISPEERRVDARAEYDGSVLKITVDDVLPRNRNDVPGSLLRRYWMGNVLYALRKLDVPVRFQRALCAVKVYCPRDVGWDVDNRAISFVINALRASEVIPGDEYDKLSVLLLGGLDKKNPRTEIQVIEYPTDTIKSLFEGMQ
jgi:hypothetical protein